MPFSFLNCSERSNRRCSKQCLIGLAIGLAIGILLVIIIAVPVGAIKNCSSMLYRGNISIRKTKT